MKWDPVPPCLALSSKGRIGVKSMRHASVMSRGCTCTSGCLKLQKQEIGSYPMGLLARQGLLLLTWITRIMEEGVRVKWVYLHSGQMCSIDVCMLTYSQSSTWFSLHNHSTYCSHTVSQTANVCLHCTAWRKITPLNIRCHDNIIM